MYYRQPVDCFWCMTLLTLLSLASRQAFPMSSSTKWVASLSELQRINYSSIIIFAQYNHSASQSASQGQTQRPSLYWEREQAEVAQDRRLAFVSSSTNVCHICLFACPCPRMSTFKFRFFCCFLFLLYRLSFSFCLSFCSAFFYLCFLMLCSLLFVFASGSMQCIWVVGGEGSDCVYRVVIVCIGYTVSQCIVYWPTLHAHELQCQCWQSLSTSLTRQATTRRVRRCSSFFSLFILFDVSIAKMESSRRKRPISTRLSIMQCRCQSLGQILHSGSMSELRSCRLASLLQCPILSLRWFWSRQKRLMEYSALGGGYFSHTLRSSPYDLFLFWMKLSSWFTSFGITFLFSFEFMRFRGSLLSLLFGIYSVSLPLALPLRPLALTFDLPKHSPSEFSQSNFRDSEQGLASGLLSLSAEKLLVECNGRLYASASS